MNTTITIAQIWLGRVVAGGTGPLVIWGGIAILVVIAACLALSLFRGTTRVIAAVEQARRELETAGDRRNLPGRFEALDDALSRATLLGGAWRRFSATLLLPREPSRPVQQTVPAERFFDTSLLRAAGLNPRLHAAMPNLLVGGGLLLTFIGLIIALRAAGGSVGSADVVQSRAALQALLNAAALKFTSSVAGLLLSILYLLLHRAQLHRLERTLAQFCDAVAERMTMVSAHSLAQDANGLLDQQLAAQQRLVSDLVGALDTSFGRRLAEQIEPLRQAIVDMAAAMSRMNQDALQDMIGHFGALLRETAGGQLSQLADTLAGMSAGLQNMMVGFSEVQTQLGAAGRTAANDLSTSIRDAGQEMKVGASAFRAAMQETAESMSAGLRAALAEVSDRLQSVIAALAAQTKAAEDAAERLGPAAAALERSAGQAAAATAPLPQLTEQLHAMIGAMQQATDAQSAAHDRAKDLAKSLDDALRRFEGLDRELGGVFTQLEGGLIKIQDKITAFAVSVDGSTARAVTQLSGAVDELKDSLAFMPVPAAV